MNFLPNKFLMVGSELEFNQSSYCQVGKVLKNLRTSYQQAFSKRSCGRNSSKRRQYFLPRSRKSVPKTKDFLPAGGGRVGSPLIFSHSSYRLEGSHLVLLITSALLSSWRFLRRCGRIPARPACIFSGNIPVAGSCSPYFPCLPVLCGFPER